MENTIDSKSISLGQIFILTVFLFSICATKMSSYSSKLIKECESGYTNTCLLLRKEAIEAKDSKSTQMYEKKFIDILDKSCRSDFESCLVLANIYGEKSLKIQNLAYLRYAIFDKEGFFKADSRDDFKADFKKSESNISESNSPTQTNQLENNEDSNIQRTGQKQNDQNVDTQEQNTTAQDTYKNQKKIDEYIQTALPLLESACYHNNDEYACLVLSHLNAHAISVALNRPKAQRLENLAMEIMIKKCVLTKEKCNITGYSKKRLEDLKRYGQDAKCQYFYCSYLDRHMDFLQDIVKNIDSLQDKCEKGDSTSCFESALYHGFDYYGNFTPKIFKENKMDLAKSTYYIKKGCEIESKLCEDTIYKDENTKKCLKDNDIKACAEGSRAEVLAMSCKNGNLDSCFYVTRLLKDVDKKDYIKSLQGLCKSGQADSCKTLSDMYKVSSVSDSKKGDFKKEILKESDSKGKARSFFAEPTNPINDYLIDKYLKKYECDAFGNCDRESSEDSKKNSNNPGDVSNDGNQALRQDIKQDSSGSTDGINSMANKDDKKSNHEEDEYGIKPDAKKSIFYAQRACRLDIKNRDKNGKYCQKAGDGYEKSGGKQDLDKAIESYRYACVKNDVGACGKLGLIYERYKNNKKKAYEWYKNGCKLNMDLTRRANYQNLDVFSCKKLAQAYINGNKAVEIKQGVIQDIAMAGEIYDQILRNDNGLWYDPKNAIIYNDATNFYMTNAFYNNEIKNREANPFRDYARALIYYQLDCLGNKNQSCDMKISFTGARDSYEYQNLQAKSLRDSKIIYKDDVVKLCKDGDHNSCYQLATLLLFRTTKHNIFDIDFRNSTILNEKLLENMISSNASNVGNVSNKQTSYNDPSEVNSTKSDANLAKSDISSAKSSNESYENYEKIVALINKLYIASCKANVKGACEALASKFFISSNDMELYKNVCLNVKKPYTNWVCQVYASYAFKHEVYDDVLRALDRFKDSKSVKDIPSLELLAGANFYLKRYEMVIDIYKKIYQLDKLAMSNGDDNKKGGSYYYLGRMFEMGVRVDRKDSEDSQNPKDPKGVWEIKKDVKRAYDIYSLIDSPQGYFGRANILERGGFKGTQSLDKGGAGAKKTMEIRDLYEKSCKANLISFSTESNDVTDQMAEYKEKPKQQVLSIDIFLNKIKQDFDKSFGQNRASMVSKHNMLYKYLQELEYIPEMSIHEEIQACLKTADTLQKENNTEKAKLYAKRACELKADTEAQRAGC